MTTKTLEKPEQKQMVPRAEGAPLALTSPFSYMHKLAEEMDRWFDELELSFGRDLMPSFKLATPAPGAWMPRIDVYEKDKQFVVRADLPGLEPKDIKLDITDEMLTLEGERKQEYEKTEEGFYRAERSYGSFYRRIPLPEGVKADAAKATFKNGVLEITMPAAEKKPQLGRRLEIGA